MGTDLLADDQAIKVMLEVNPQNGVRFKIKDERGDELGHSKIKFWSNLWNTFFGWLIAMPTNDDLSVLDNELVVESRLRFTNARFRISVNHQPVAMVTTKSFRGNYSLNVKNERYELQTGLGNTHFVIVDPTDQVVVDIRRQAGVNEAYLVTVSSTFGMLTGVGLAMAILAGHGK